MKPYTGFLWWVSVQSPSYYSLALWFFTTKYKVRWLHHWLFVDRVDLSFSNLPMRPRYQGKCHLKFHGKFPKVHSSLCSFQAGLDGRGISPHACCNVETALRAVKINVCATWYEQVFVFNPGVIFSLELLNFELWREFAVEIWEQNDVGPLGDAFYIWPSPSVSLYWNIVITKGLFYLLRSIISRGRSLCVCAIHNIPR